MAITTLDQLQVSLQKTKQYIDGEITEVNAAIPINNNQLTNGAGYQTESDVKTLINNLAPDIDATLSTTGQAADAKAVGDAIQSVQDSMITESQLKNDYLNNLSFELDESDILSVVYQDPENPETLINARFPSDTTGGYIAEVIDDFTSCLAILTKRGDLMGDHKLSHGENDELVIQYPQDTLEASSTFVTDTTGSHIAEEIQYMANIWKEAYDAV